MSITRRSPRSWRSPLCVVVLAATSASAWARTAYAAEGAGTAGAADTSGIADTAAVVADVAFEGLRRVDPEAVVGFVKSARGAALDPEQVTADLRALWATSFFRDVRAETEAVEGGVRLVFVVQERPSVREIQYAGIGDLSEEDIKAVVDLKPFAILNVDQLKRNAEKIKDLYVEKGFYLATVAYRVEAIEDTDAEVNVVFDITENAKVVVRQITFVGNKALGADQLRQVMQTQEGSELSWLSQAGTYKKEYFQTDLFRLQALYWDNGFVTVKIGEPTATISQDRRFIYLTVPIFEGKQYKVGNIKFAGQVKLEGEQGAVLVDQPMLEKRLTIASGDVFNRTKLFTDIQTLTDVYRDQGYAYANVTPNSAVHEDTLTVDLDLEVERGDLVYFERIEMVGNTRTRDKVIRRELRIFEGEKFSATAVNSSRARIFQLGFFENVNITTNRGSSPDLMTVQVEVKEKSTGTFQIGAGFSSAESFIATAQISQNNFLGNGQLLSISAQLSFGDFARQLATLQFYEPYFLDTQWSLGMNAYVTQRYYRDFARNSTGVSPSFGYPITPDLRVNAGYTLEDIEISTDFGSGSSGTRLYNLNRDGLNSAVNGSISFDTRDNRLFPSSGHHHVLSGEVSDPMFGSDEGLAYRRVQLAMRRYVPLPLSFVLKLNASFGMIFGGGDQGVPISERFFPGGIYSVRGFVPRGLGPTIDVPLSGDDVTAETRPFTIGGNKEAVFNLEVEFPIIEAAGIKGVIFADAGNAFDDAEGFFYAGTPHELIPPAYLLGSTRAIDPPLGLYYSWGFGFRWFSPIGPLRFEWGIPITKRNPRDDSVLFEFTIGNFF